MKVAYVTMQFPVPSETFACTDVQVLTSLGFRVDVYGLRPAHRRHATLLRERGLEDVRVHPMTVKRAVLGLWLTLFRWRRTLPLFAWVAFHSWRTPTHLLKSCVLVPGAVAISADLESEGYDVVHLFWGHYPSLVGHLLSSALSPPVTSTFLGAYDLTERYGPGSDFARRADIVFTHAHTNVAAIVALGVETERIRVVHRGVPPWLLDRVQGTGSEIRDTQALLTVSRLIPSKRTEDVIATLGLLARQGRNATLTVIGEGPDQPRLEKLATRLGIADRVRFLGHQPQECVVTEMRRCTAFVLLSTKTGERLPNVVKEAMACGCVPIVAATAGIEELVEDGADGFIVRPGDDGPAIDSVVALVDEVLRGGPRIEKMRSKARERITEAFDARDSMRAYAAAWLSQLHLRQQKSLASESDHP